MKIYWLYYSISLCVLISAVPAWGQISPGELSKAHAELEGMSKCTLCHDLGKKVSNLKCMECHKEIKSLVNKKSGYHASAAVSTKDCFDCHSEHHGRKFDMTRFDEKNFDHALTQYGLVGKHATTECNACHKPDNIADKDIRKRTGTYLGLKHECLACHDNYHQNTLDNNCTLCHDMKAFQPAAKFNHANTDFKLRGKHVTLDCKECHQMVTKNGNTYQEFANVSHNDCKACHEDPHQNRITGSCTQCHNEQSFTEFIGSKRFDHNTTSFALKGKHVTVECFSCHKTNHDAATVFDIRPTVSPNQCASCHVDVHKGKFGKNCVQCHQETGFTSVKKMTAFNHARADFPLEGKHIGVDCKLCHKKKYTDPINFSACKNCHEDYHQGEFTKNEQSPDCAACHTVLEKFNHTTYTLDQHQKTKFPLEGAHSATACYACHVSEEKWKFGNMNSTCIQCHENIHEDRFAVEGTTTCERCHDTANWFPGKFDHNLTDFPLTGRHRDVECKACHKPYEENGKTKLEYTIKKFECIDCHQ